MRRRARLAVLLTIFATAAWLLSWCLARLLQVNVPLERADAIVILSGSEGYIERTQLAATLYHQGRAPVVILTNDNNRGGWSNAEGRNPYFVERAAAELHAAGIANDRIHVLTEPVSSTYQEAVLLRDYTSVHQCRALIFVTSPYHSRRALWTLRRVFSGTNTEIGIETPQPGQQSPLPYSWWFSIRGWRQVALEYPKLVYYQLNYR